MEDYNDFIIPADNENKVADVQETSTENTNNETEDNTIDTETTEKVAPTDVEEVENTDTKTETQRVSQRINEARQQAKDEFIATQGYEWNGKQITTEAQYKEALSEQAQQKRDADLEEKGINPKDLTDAVENNPTVMQAKALLAEQATEKAQQKNYNDFVAAFPDVKPEQIKKSTWLEVNEGSTLVDAYTRQENKEMKAKLKVFAQNETNKSKAPIAKGLSAHGSQESASEDEFSKGFDSVK